MQAQARKSPKSKLGQASRPRWIGHGAALLAFGCLLLNAGAAVGGTITFSGTVVVGTCEVPTTASLTGAPAQAECSHGTDQGRPEYRVQSEEIAVQSGIRLLRYAKDRYPDAKLVTYTYE